MAMIKELYSTALIFKYLRRSVNLRETAAKRSIVILIGLLEAAERDLVMRQVKMEKRMTEWI